MPTDAPQNVNADGAAPDRVAQIGGVFGIITGIAGLLASIYTCWEIHKDPHSSGALLLAVMYLTTTNFLFAAVSAGYILSNTNKSRRIARLRVDRASLAGQVKQLEVTGSTRLLVDRDISRERMLISHIHTEYCAKLRKYLQGKETDKLAVEFGAYLEQMLTHSATLFTSYTGDTCSACIKMFTLEGGEPCPPDLDAPGRHPAYVYTLMRDGTSSHVRSVVSPQLSLYNYADNAAFFNILHKAEEPDFFVSDNLTALEVDKKYWNKNPQWRTLYNATAVVPIRYSAQSIDEYCAGLLCIDNMKGGFDSDSTGLLRERAVHILTGISSDLYYSIRTTMGMIAVTNGSAR